MWAHMIKSYPGAFPPAVTNEVNKLDPQILEATAKHRMQEKVKWFIECIDFSLGLQNISPPHMGQNVVASGRRRTMQGTDAHILRF